MKKLKVKQIKEVECPNCQGSGEINVVAHYMQDCKRCDKTGKLKIEVEHCKGCGEELFWFEWDYILDEEKEMMYKCENECTVSGFHVEL